MRTKSGRALKDADTLSAARKARLEALAALPEEAIDLSDIPELPDAFWRNAKPGQFYRPVKRQLTLRLDADVIEWFKSHTAADDGYQTHINRALRQYVLGHGNERG